MAVIINKISLRLIDKIIVDKLANIILGYINFYFFILQVKICKTEFQSLLKACLDAFYL